MSEIRQNKNRFCPENRVDSRSGLGDYGNSIQIESVIKYSEIEDFPISTVMGHNGVFSLWIWWKTCRWSSCRARFIITRAILFPTWYCPYGSCGRWARRRFLSPTPWRHQHIIFPRQFHADLRSYLFSVPSPLIGVNIQQLGTRFPDMSEIYSSDLRNIIKQAAQDLEIPSMRVSIYSFPPEL